MPINTFTISWKDLLMPIALLLLVFLSVWMLTGEISRVAYTSFQSDAFIALNYFLNQSLGINPYVWSNITYLGNTLVLLLLFSFFLIVQPKVWAAIFGSIPMAGLLSGAGKTLFAVPRPAAVLDHDSFIIIDKVLTGHSSLPSGHTITVFCIISAVLLCFKRHPHYRKIMLLTFSIGAVLVISRVAVGAHWPLDIVVGAAFGYIAALSGVFLVERYQGWWSWLKKPQYNGVFALILLLTIIALIKEEHAFSGFNGIVWVASMVGLFTIAQLIKGYKKC